MNVAVTVRLVVKLFTVHTCPAGRQFDQLPKVDPVLGVAVNVTGVPLVKLALHTVGQLIPPGALLTVPLPPPARATVRTGPDPPELPVKQTTLAVIDPVTIAPAEDTVPELFVVIVAETMVPPQSTPVAVTKPVELTVAMPGVPDAQVTWPVMSLVTGG